MINAEEAKKITEESQQALRQQDAERISKYLETLSERIKEKAMHGGTRLRVEFPEGLGYFYSPSQVKDILIKSMESFGFRIEDILTKADCAFIISWD